MAATTSYTVTLRDHTTEHIEGADAYATERVLTTFFRTANARGAVDCWSVAVASFRTDEILSIRRIETTNTTSDSPAIPADGSPERFGSLAAVC